MRQPGYYWVKIDGQWMIGEFKNDSWYFCDPMMDFPGGHDGDDFEEIDERRIERPIDSNKKPHWKEVADAIQSVFDKNQPQYLSDNPYLCKDE